MDQETFDRAKKGLGPRNGAKPSKWDQALTKRGSLTWKDVGPDDLMAALVAVTEDGAALLLSKTSDGGALLVQVLVDKDTKPKHYASNMAELNEVLANLGSVE